MYKLCVYVPAADLDAVKQAMFAAGGGKIGDYDNCCWQVAGEGQFRPLDGSSPAIGEHGRLETVSEYKVELVCEDTCIRAVIAAMKKAHSYEQPAYDVLLLADL
jgi:hypothetical protein